MKDNLWWVKNGNNKAIFNPIINNFDPIPPGWFRYSEEKMNELINSNLIHFHSDWSLPRLKRYLFENEDQRPKSIMSDDQRPDYSLLKELNTPFDNPKQIDFMKRIISLVESSSIVLDFFSWSWTSAHAVMQLNSEDWWNRKFICVQIQEETDNSSEAFKAWYKNICEIWKERIRRAWNKIKEENKDKEWIENLDVWFRVFKIDSSNIKDVNIHPNDITQKNLFETEKNIKEDRTSEDLLIQVILNSGLTLDLSIETKEILWNKVYFVAGNSLAACFDEDVNFWIVEELAKLEPLKVVFRDSSFKNDSDRINFDTKFKKLSPESDLRVI